ncbi:MAG: hypothetical protein K6U11_03040 [bacterium]|nr:hypothetical protein [bacterium]
MVEIRKYPIKSKKVNLKVVIFTSDTKIIGTIHIPGGRLTDFLNSKGSSEVELFIPITDASIYEKNSDNMLYFTKFLSINREQIMFIFPLDDDSEVAVE